MPLVRKMILGHVVSDLYNKMSRRKKLDGDILETPMKRCLSTVDITLLGKRLLVLVCSNGVLNNKDKGNDHYTIKIQETII